MGAHKHPKNQPIEGKSEITKSLFLCRELEKGGKIRVSEGKSGL